ncbi:MAG TPA: hypothetical protein VFG48_02915, partial [Xanthomonadales bacterium]|nr:hypothetical protein [Xanthomonadales bacterium]
MAAGTANRRSYAVCAWLRLVATLATMLACAQPYARSDAEVAAVETVVPPGAEAGATGGETAGSDAPPKAP